MNDMVQIAIPVTAETARAPGDARRMQAVGRMADRMVRPGAGADPLAAGCAPHGAACATPG